MGSINTVGNYSISNTYSQANVKFTNQPSGPLNLTFSNLNNNLPLSTFSISPDLKTAISSEKLIFADGQQSQTLKVASLTIDNVQRTNLTLINHVFQPGVYYEIDITLKRAGFEIGPILYALGNLIYENGVYKMASNQGINGDYWYKTPDGRYYEIPRALQPKHNDGDTLIGKVVDDICNKLGSGWRQPTPTEAMNLRIFGSWDAQYEPNGQKAYVAGTYQRNTVSVQGLFFGTSVQPSVSQQDDFLFLPFAGMSNSGILQDVGTLGAYWHSGRNSTYGYSYQFTNSYFTAYSVGGDHPKRANTVRCVKTK